MTLLLGSISARPALAQTNYSANSPTSPLRSNWVANELVQGHLALSRGWIERKEFSLAPNLLTRLGAPDYITRHVKGGEEGPWWNTAAGSRYCSPKDKGCTRSPAKEIVDASQNGDKRVIAYYRHLWEKSAAETDPSVVCIDQKGVPQTHSDGQVFLSLSSSYKDTVKQRMVELAKMGYEAVYLDFKHQPETGCWDSATRTAYTQVTGRTVPAPSADSPFVADLSNPAFRSYLAFNNRQIGIAFKEWQDAGRAVNPRFTLIISASYSNSLTTPHLSTNMFPAGSIAKTEFRLPIVIGPQNGGAFYRAPANMPQLEDSSRMAFGYSMLRSATFNSPPHVWTHVSRVDPATANLPDKKFLPPTKEELIRGAAAVLGLGGIANIHIDNEAMSSARLQSEYQQTFAATKKWTEKIGAKSLAVSHIGVFFSERIRWQKAGTRDSFWMQSNFPALASFDVVNELGIPAQVVVDRELSRGLPSYLKAIILTDAPASLTANQLKQLETFVSNGGDVIDASGISWTADSYAASRAWLASRVELVSKNAFVRVKFPKTAKQRTFTVLADPNAGAVGPKVLLIPNDYSWVQRLGPDEVNVRSEMRGISLSFPPSVRPPAVSKLATEPPTRLTPVKDASTGGWRVDLPASSEDLAIYSIP
ncbi:MAG: hypothetical protein U0136_07475 [Bdellovibrionota bacterium]